MEDMFDQLQDKQKHQTMKVQMTTARTTKSRRWHKNQTCFESGQDDENMGMA
jgi:hypothetical protein